MQKFSITTNSRIESVDITSPVANIVRTSGIEEGICCVYVPHTTAGVIINENADPDVKKDIMERLTKIAPKGDGYHHLEGNADAHIKSALANCSVTFPIAGGRMDLGTWQGIYFVEFDGPRHREVWVQVVGK